MSASNQKSSMQKTLSLWNFFTIGFGAIIGTGWVLMVGDWMIIGGGPVAAMIAFIIAYRSCIRRTYCSNPYIRRHR